MTDNIESMFSLENKVAIVTGASRGIGMEIARCFSAAGARLVICSRKQEAVDAAAHDISMEGTEILPLAINVGDMSQRQRLIRETMDWGGRIDIVVNNAGANPAFGGLESLTEEALDTIINVNLKAALFISQMAFNAWMKDNGGTIINVSSVGGRQYMPGISGYCAVKAALNHLGRCMAGEWGKYGVRVNTLLPGIIKTKFSQVLWESPQFKSSVEKSPMGRFGDVDELVGAALFLASESSGYTTGTELIVDGGALVGGY